MKTHHHRSRRKNRSLWIIGLGSLVWLLLRSGTNPRRLAYPCQRAALVSGSGFLGYLASLVGATHLHHRLRHKATLAGVGFFILALLLTAILTGSDVPSAPVYASPTLPAWTSPSAVSEVFAVTNVPTPTCSLDGGTLPATPPCNAASYALRDEGVDALVNLMESEETYFYRTTQHPDGIVGANDVVVVKVNNQWGAQGSGDGYGRLSTNTDVLKGLIWRILQHPDGFTGEVVVAENTQGGDGDNDWDAYPANAQYPGQSFQDVVVAFQSQGHPVSLYDWTSLNDTLTRGGSVDGPGYPVGEYANGVMTDTYILLEDPAAAGTDELSYPKFRTANGTYVSMRYGVWNGSSYDDDRLIFINLPVLKAHCMAGATIAWKNLIGFVTIADHDTRYGSWDKMHAFYWGHQDETNTYGLVGREMALIRAPDLHVVDAIWVADYSNYQGTAVRQDVLLASTDPFAVDWYASEYVLRPLVTSPPESGTIQDISAARDSLFRRATRTNQNSAKSVWSNGSYPYMDLLDSYDGSTPSDDEKNQMNVYVVGGAACEAITGVGITGPTVGFTDTLHTFTAVVTPSAATTPITYTWSPEPVSGQGAASARYQWATPDVYTITLQAENCGGSDTATHAITIAGTRWDVYLPLVLRSYAP